MENKKTSELLDLLHEKSKEGDWTDECKEICGELRNREPFYSMSHDNDGRPIEDSIELTDENIKKLKRHKHDEKNGDVLIRI